MHESTLANYLRSARSTSQAQVNARSRARDAQRGDYITHDDRHDMQHGHARH